MIRVNGPTPSYYLVCTTDYNHEAAKFPLRRSVDLARWDDVGHVFPAGQLPAWAVRDFWAPEIHAVGSRFVCYYSARDRSRRLCIGAAEASSIEGPWTDLGRPFIRDAKVGMIDAHWFRDDDGRQYLYWKGDTNALRPRRPTPIFVQELTPDGLGFVGEARTLFINDLPWEGDVVEGPWVVRRAGLYYLFYSGNAFNTEAYATGVARAASPFGPFQKIGEPILQSCADWKGPGHGCVVEHGGDDYFVYHAWERDRVKHGRHPRVAMIGRIRWIGEVPKIEEAPAFVPATAEPSMSARLEDVFAQPPRLDDVSGLAQAAAQPPMGARLEDVFAQPAAQPPMG